MTDPRTQELLNGAIDNALDPAERDELKHLLARDPRAATRLQALQRMTRAIEDLGQADPPADLVKGVMQAVSTGRTNGVSSTEGGMGMARKVMMGLAAAAAVVLGVFAVTGYPPIGRGTEGSIDAAKRYQSQQLAAKDVVLGDTAVQEFLQSDVFDRLMRDDAARKLLSNARYREAFAQIGVVKALSDDSVSLALKNQELLDLFGDSAVLAAFEHAAFREMLGNVRLVNAVADENVTRALAVDEFALALRNDVQFRLKLSEMALNHRLTDALYLKSIENANIRNVVGDAQIAAALSQADLALKMKSNDFAVAITTPAVIAALKSNELQTAMKQEVFANLFGLKMFQDALAVQGVRLALGDPNFSAAIQAGVLQLALKQNGFEQAIASAQFEAALAKARY